MAYGPRKEKDGHGSDVELTSRNARGTRAPDRD